jgi:phosphatidylglycerol:prolipoprotein diacylglycerol transferase
MFPVLNLGPLTLPAPQLILLIGIWLGISLAEIKAKRSGHNAEILFKVIWVTILAGILGARLSFAARNPVAFQGQWISLISLNQALFDPVGGLLIAIAAGYIVAARNQHADWALLDDLVPFFAVLAPAVFLSNFASGSGFGTFSDLPWSIDLWGGPRHPVQLYYLFASLAVLLLITIGRGSIEQKPGSSIISFIIYSSGYLTALSAFQDPGGYLVAGFRPLQLFSWAIFTTFIFIHYAILSKEVNNEVV